MQDVSDIRSNPQDQIAHAARVLGHSAHRRKVFEAIYNGKKKIKTLEEIKNLTCLNEIRILQEAGKLAGNKIVEKTKINNKAAYKKDPFYTQNKSKILSLAKNKKALDSFPTKTNPISKIIKIQMPRNKVSVRQVFIDDITSFKKAKGIHRATLMRPIDEIKFKHGVKRLLGEFGTFQDWGGEKNDLFSTRVLIQNKRKSTAFAFKGKGTKGPLTPKKMGKNGDQIQRLFSSPAEVFIIQYWNIIDQSIFEQMRTSALSKSYLESRPIYYCIIDGLDTSRLVLAYPEYFR